MSILNLLFFLALIYKIYFTDINFSRLQDLFIFLSIKMKLDIVKFTTFTYTKINENCWYNTFIFIFQRCVVYLQITFLAKFTLMFNSNKGFLFGLIFFFSLSSIGS